MSNSLSVKVKSTSLCEMTFEISNGIWTKMKKETDDSLSNLKDMVLS